MIKNIYSIQLFIFVVVFFISFLPVSFAEEKLSLNDLEYFCEISLGSEFGDKKAILRKWTNTIRIQIHGRPSEEDLKTTKLVLKELDGLTGDLKFESVETSPNLHLHFIPHSLFRKTLPQYRPLNMGYVWCRWSGSGEIQEAKVLISTTHTTQKVRNSLIREELTQSLGLLNDSVKYKNSIFYQRYHVSDKFSEVDKKIIRTLYSTKLKPNMSKDEVLAVLEGDE